MIKNSLGHLRARLLLFISVPLALLAGADCFAQAPSPCGPVLLSEARSTRAIALESVVRTSEPFTPDSAIVWGTDRRTRVVLFAMGLDLLPGEGASAVTADAEDEAGRHHPQLVEYVGKVPGYDWVSSAVLRLSDDLGDVGDVLIRLSLHGVPSNRVRVGVGHVGGGPPDDRGAKPTPPPSFETTQYLEAEGSNLAPPMATLSDSKASGGQYISSATQGGGTASFTFGVRTAGTFYVWGRVLAPNFNQDSFYVAMDCGAEDTYDVAEGTWSSQWQWTRVNGRAGTGAPLTLNPRTFNLAAGVHTITFRGRDANTKLDRIFITDDSGQVPSDPPPAPDTTPPTVSLTSPAPGASVSGSVTVSANASDDFGVAGVQFKLDGANLGAEDTTAPYSGVWDTAGASNGSHTLTAVARDAAGNSAISAAVSVTVSNLPTASISLSPTNITQGQPATLSWSTTNATAVSIDQGVGPVAASGARTVSPAATTTYTLTATNGAGSRTDQVTLTVGALTPPPGFYVAPNGSPSGNGSLSSPWDLQTALNQPAGVTAGSTIYLRGGVYAGRFTSNLTGTASAPVTVRSYPGEWAVLDWGRSSTVQDTVLAVNGAYAWYRDFEVRDSNLAGRPTTFEAGVTGVNVYGPGTKFINLVVHDNTGQGFGFWQGAVDAEIYGCIIYNNGVSSRDHGVYTQNRDGTKQIRDNIIWGQSGFPVHAYGSSAAFLTGFRFEGNAVFMNAFPRFLVGGDAPAGRILLTKNYLYQTKIELGYSSHANLDAAITDNYVYGQSPLDLKWWQSLAVTNNTVVSSQGSNNVELTPPQGGRLSDYAFNNNTYYRGIIDSDTPFYIQYPDGSEVSYTFTGWQALGFDSQGSFVSAPNPSVPTRPAVNFVEVRPNLYESGRAHILVFNWNLLNSVSVSLANSGLTPGQQYKVLDGQNYLGSPVATGTYDPANPVINIPLTGLTAAQPIGTLHAPSPHAAPEFGVFVVAPR